MVCLQVDSLTSDSMLSTLASLILSVVQDAVSASQARLSALLAAFEADHAARHKQREESKQMQYRWMASTATAQQEQRTQVDNAIASERQDKRVWAEKMIG